MDTTSRKRRNWYDFTLLGWPAAAAHARVECNCARLIEASSRASTLEVPAPRLPHLSATGHSGTRWLAMRRAVLRHPDPALTQSAAGRGVPLWLTIGEPLSDLLADHALLAENGTRRQEVSEFSGIGNNPRSHGGATVAPPSRSNGKPREQSARWTTGRNVYMSLDSIGEVRCPPRIPTNPLRSVTATLELVGIGCGTRGAGPRPAWKILPPRCARPCRTETRQPPPPADTRRSGDDRPGVRADDVAEHAATGRRRGSPSAGISPGRTVPPRWRHRRGNRSPTSPCALLLARARRMVGNSIVGIVLGEPPALRTCSKWPPSSANRPPRLYRHRRARHRCVQPLPSHESPPASDTILAHAGQGSRPVAPRTTPASHAGRRPGKVTARPSRTRARASRRWRGSPSRCGGCSARR